MSSADAAPAPLLQVDKLHLTYERHGGAWGKVVERVHALRGISFHLEAGETLALVGESGCGKSTTARCIVDLEQANSGRIVFQGENLLEMKRGQRRASYRHIQMVFQDPYASLNQRQSIREKGCTGNRCQATQQKSAAITHCVSRYQTATGDLCRSTSAQDRNHR